MSNNCWASRPGFLESNHEPTEPRGLISRLGGGEVQHVTQPNQQRRMTRNFQEVARVLLQGHGAVMRKRRAIGVIWLSLQNGFRIRRSPEEIVRAIFHSRADGTTFN